MTLVRSDPFRDVDRLFQELWRAQQSGPRPMAMPMDAYRKDDSFLLQLDLPGVTPESIELTVDENVLTISAERPAPPKASGSRRRRRMNGLGGRFPPTREGWWRG